MAMLTPFEIAQVVLLAIAGVAASVMDVRFRIIPNWLCALVLLAGLAFGFASGGWEVGVSSFFHVLVALVCGMLLFAGGFIGGGDAKFYAGIAAWFALRDGLFLFVSVALSGLAVLLVWFIARRAVAGAQAAASGEDVFAKLPYGVAISLGAVTSALTLALRN